MWSKIRMGSIEMANRIVMAPLTRSRANDRAEVGELQATYYAQRASAGLIVAEGTSPSPDGLGYARTPAIYSEEQVAGWRQVTDAVHKAGGRIVLQLMHVGRIAHPLNQPPGARVVAPSAVAANLQMWTDREGMKPMVTPSQLTDDEIQKVIREYAQAAVNARAAGFDGVELHGANGYLVHQFLSTNTNRRSGPYGGSVENRSRFAIEAVESMAAAWESGRIGIRLSPGGGFNDIYDEESRQLYPYLVRELSRRDLAYVHVIRPQGFVPESQAFDVVKVLRENYQGNLMVNGGLDLQQAQQLLDQGLADAFSFGRMFIANPNLPEVMQKGLRFAEPDGATFYTPGPKGYTDYPPVVA